MRSIKAKYMEQQRFSGLLLASVRKSMNLIVHSGHAAMKCTNQC